MYDVIKDHGIKNVWCAPGQDRQAIIKPARLTPTNGAMNSVTVFWDKYTLPVQHVRFHIYQVGQLHPYLVGLLDTNDAWCTFADVCSRNSLIVDIYAESGIEMPRTEVWYRITENRNLIIAVKRQDRIAIDFNNDPLYFRVYKNAYFGSKESDPLNDYISVQGGTVTTTDAILDLQHRYNLAKQQAGVTYAFVNGMMIDSLDLITVRPGDVAEFVYDSSIYRTLTFNVASLPTFISSLDLVKKYLLHYPGQFNNIVYQDDIDLFVMYPTDATRNAGVYYHRNKEMAVRMVTHKDYGIPTDNVANLSNARKDWTNADAVFLRVHLRKSGFTRPLVNECNRIKELYKLTDAEVLQAMIGVNSTVNNWKAAVLEDSDYTRIMRLNLNSITRQLVQEAYGYNAISKLVANTPSFVQLINGVKGVVVPYELITDSIAYEYDADGLLLGWYQHRTGGTLYPVNNQNAHMVEMISGTANTQLDEIYGDHIVYLDPGADYRMYICHMVEGLPDNVWQDVTSSDLYSIDNNVLTWHTDPTVLYTMVRGNHTVLAYDFEHSANDGLLKFPLVHEQYRNGVVSNWIMQVPMGELDVFLNNHSLIENIDYYVNFPEVVITNKEYLVNPETDKQRIVIRFSGFCLPDFSREQNTDLGFISHGLLSNNNRFDVRDDKVLRIVVRGRLYDRSELKFSESDTGVNVPDAKNGSPYLVRDIVVPLRGGTIDTTYSLRAEAKAIDKVVSDYMTTKVPSPVFDTPNVIVDRYAVYSPFCSKIIFDMKNGVLADPRLKTFYNDLVVREICAPYENLLNFDPVHRTEVADSEYMVIHPHNRTTTVDLDVYQYKFIKRVITLYLQDRVDISHFIQLI